MNVRISNHTLVFSGHIGLHNVDHLIADATKAIKTGHPTQLDLSGIESIDNAGVAALEEIIVLLEEKQKIVLISPPGPDISELIETFASAKVKDVFPPEPISYFERTGQVLLTRFDSFVKALTLASEIFYWSIVAIFDRRAQRKGVFLQQGTQLGFDALPIVALLSFIIGFILALQSAVQLRNFGANMFIADLLAVTMVREMGPMITAIIVAGRSGSSIASEIATMKVTEELDALKMMALNPIRYVVVPKFHAITVMMPILVAFSILVGEMGGAVIAISYLDLSLETFLSRTIDIITAKDLIVTFAKSTVFAWLIVIIGAHYGFQVSGGAEGVGKATTASVVVSIFAVIIADAVFSLIYL
ncbi:MAG: MlaE family lipid ABC transporter permease subunit [Candidatus Cloacimonadaceae bacterium]|nr:MlaE family lipid ABC transporter permease subunit [Candidatus Cloacimonadaceae bacterium]